MNYKEKQEELRRRAAACVQMVYEHRLAQVPDGFGGLVHKFQPARRTEPKPKRVGKARREYFRRANIYGK